MKTLAKYSMGIGDRFGQQGAAQLEAFRLLAQREGVLVTPVWNKSEREHQIVGTQPQAVREEADETVRAANWSGAYFVDADHITRSTVDRFIVPSDFFTLDVADYMGETIEESEIYGFLARHDALIGTHEIEGLPEPLSLTRAQAAEAVRATLFAIRQAGKLYRHIAQRKGADTFITEISMDETMQPQTPVMLLVALAAIAEEQIPIQTIAPKFTGRFNKGVDYVGDAAAFGAEFDADVAVLAYAVKTYGLPETLKLSIHSGSDKFALYPHVARTLETRQAGVHVKTAGTTWLEEVVGLAVAGGDGLALVKEIYANALPRFDELCAPYATVIDVHPARLPLPSEVAAWHGGQLAAALRHVPDDAHFNPDFRQFMHVAYKVAAEYNPRYRDALVAHRQVVARHVTENLYNRHLKPIFGNLGPLNPHAHV